jgi:outer membrane murein-binding lipoprotein Lpp
MEAGRVAVAAVMLGAAVLAGCGSSDSASTASTTTASAASAATVDIPEVESQIKTQLSTPSVQATSVKCPSDVSVKQGDTFTCTVYFSNNGGGKVKVTQQGLNRYTYELIPGSVTVPGSWAASQIEASLAKQGVPGTTATCPSTIVVKVGTTVTCDLRGPHGLTGTVTFTFSNANGTVDSSSVKTS